MKNEIKLEAQFDEISQFIVDAKQKAYRSVNQKLIELYLQVGNYVSLKLSSAEWGEGIVDKLSIYIQKRHPEMKGFSRKGLYRMKQFCKIYKGNGKVSALLAQIIWTNHLLILSKSKSEEEREFYLLLTAKEKYSSRELERQLKS